MKRSEEKTNDRVPTYCWDFIECPNSVRSKCKVFIDKSHNCWDYPETGCSEILDISNDCSNCRYFNSQQDHSAVH